MRTLAKGYDSTETHTVHWDGQDDNGHDVAAGVYFVRLLTPEQGYTKKVILLR